ncbi:hypothetical protein RKE30_03055 [Streptomyces sp. Li-HN-5-11]|uniref:DUF7848 domain-containing protein n=1 Tax=Streptomyces sp. Li-HN-5-11 TaxID=3075432 RepID=UPI0028A8C779|nr:hypothetical protein [Streptomyces sp. Li-HN-5-11]WNM29440.1 hypothetical protein RKE30_03055 [Streptomyces sp. Li-HN-5-11]
MAERIVREIDRGTLVYDPEADKVGEYRGKAGPHAMLRPVGGGREWEADPDLIRPATAEERLSATVKAANARSLAGRCGPEDVSRPPVPFPDCATCTELAVSRAVARAQADGTTETDANVLLRRHQRRDHEETEPAPARPRLFRYVGYVIVQDPSAEPEYEARCVSGDESDCGAASGAYPDPRPVEEWQRRHTQETQHLRYRRTFADYAVLERL